MPREMRFCRACGFRLGEGVAEFTETVRFQNPPRTAPPVATAASPKSNPFGQFNEWGTLARDIKQKVESATKHLEQKQRKQQGRKQKRHRSHWMSWMILIIIISAVSSGSLINSSGLRGLRDQLRGLSSASATRSWVGVNEFRTAEGGVTFDQVEPPDSPADKAGLVGGDVITSFDGQTIKNEGEIRKLLAATPTGKTVDVVYIRDGVTKTTKLTTISQAEMERLNDLAGERTDGFVGIGTDRERVQIPGTNTYGVQLNKIRQNNPADTAGIKNGDIIIEFAGVPIRTDEELESRTRRAAPGSMVTVVVMRDGQRLEIPVKVGTD
jgi:membrane-associated protease RseP (regulator of RpoE activity)